MKEYTDAVREGWILSGDNHMDCASFFLSCQDDFVNVQLWGEHFKKTPLKLM